MDSNAMNKFEFLLGDWNLESRIPKSIFSEAGSDTGIGSFKRALNDKYVFFEYSSKSGGEAKGIFAWDDKIKVYRYWWFENSGDYSAATCNFINDEVIAMNWHDSILVSSQCYNVINYIMYILHNQLEGIKYEEIHRDAY
jgi:hypothetical protein